jgi:hypothetical protein
MGWTADSDQGEKYPKGEIARKAQEFALEVQAELFKPVTLVTQ